MSDRSISTHDPEAHMERAQTVNGINLPAADHSSSLYISLPHLSAILTRPLVMPKLCLLPRPIHTSKLLKYWFVPLTWGAVD